MYRADVEPLRVQLKSYLDQILRRGILMAHVQLLWMRSRVEASDHPEIRVLPLEQHAMLLNGDQASVDNGFVDILVQHLLKSHRVAQQPVDHVHTLVEVYEQLVIPRRALNRHYRRQQYSFRRIQMDVVVQIIFITRGQFFWRQVLRLIQQVLSYVGYVHREYVTVILCKRSVTLALAMRVYVIHFYIQGDSEKSDVFETFIFVRGFRETIFPLTKSFPKSSLELNYYCIILQYCTIIVQRQNIVQYSD